MREPDLEQRKELVELWLVPQVLDLFEVMRRCRPVARELTPYRVMSPACHDMREVDRKLASKGRLAAASRWIQQV